MQVLCTYMRDEPNLRAAAAPSRLPTGPWQHPVFYVPGGPRLGRHLPEMAGWRQLAKVISSPSETRIDIHHPTPDLRQEVVGLQP